MDVSESLQVIAILAKFPAIWNDYERKLLHSSNDFNVDQLTKHIWIEEETRKHESKYALKIGAKVNNVESNRTNNLKKVNNKAEKKSLRLQIRTFLTRKRTCHAIIMERRVTLWETSDSSRNRRMKETLERKKYIMLNNKKVFLQILLLLFCHFLIWIWVWLPNAIWQLL